MKTMPTRDVPLVNNQIYHVVNRGVGGIAIFNGKYDYKRFLDLLDFYSLSIPIRFSHFDRMKREDKRKLKIKSQKEDKTLQILAFSLVKNHFHLVLRQLENDAISSFMAKVENGYARYFNLINKRKGPLYEDRFFARRVETDGEMLHVVRYVHLNCTSHRIVSVEQLVSYPWSSLPAYLGKRNYSFLEKKFVMNFFEDRQSYYDFVKDQADYQKKLDIIKHLIKERVR